MRFCIPGILKTFFISQNLFLRITRIKAIQVDDAARQIICHGFSFIHAYWSPVSYANTNHVVFEIPNRLVDLTIEMVQNVQPFKLPILVFGKALLKLVQIGMPGDNANPQISSFAAVCLKIIVQA